MKEIKQIAIVVVLSIGAFVSMSSIYTVSEVEQMIITQFGKPVGDPIVTPGLQFKIPFVQTVNRFEKRFLEWDGYPNQVPTRDKRFIWVDTTARWNITDPLLFFQRLRDERGAQSRLDDILDGATRNAIANHDLPSQRHQVWCTQASHSLVARVVGFGMGVAVSEDAFRIWVVDNDVSV